MCVGGYDECVCACGNGVCVWEERVNVWEGECYVCVGGN